jgi:hypothetical protein
LKQRVLLLVVPDRPSDDGDEQEEPPARCAQQMLSGHKHTNPGSRRSKKPDYESVKRLGCQGSTSGHNHFQLFKGRILKFVF